MTKSFDITYRIGAQVGEYFGMGDHGSFAVRTTSKVTVGNVSEVYLRPGTEYGEPFHSYRVDAYWLKHNPNGYWMPLERWGTGEAPWFITDKDSDIDPPQ